MQSLIKGFIIATVINAWLSILLLPALIKMSCTELNLLADYFERSVNDGVLVVTITIGHGNCGIHGIFPHI